MGTWEYKHLGSVPAAENSLRRMVELLAGPLCGWPRERLLPLANKASPGNLPDRLVTAFDGISDVALFYYVGHGQISSDNQLCLGLVQSRPDPNRRAATSLRFSDVRQALQDSGAAIKIVILDCCFAGLATSSPALAGLTGDVLDLTAGTGAYTMAATSAYGTAWYEDEPGLARPQTYFTKYLADLVEEGIPGQPCELRLDPLFKRLRNNLAADGRPIPATAPSTTPASSPSRATPPRHPRSETPNRNWSRLGRQLAETDAQIKALKTEAAERERELERLRHLLAAPGRTMPDKSASFRTPSTRPSVSLTGPGLRKPPSPRSSLNGPLRRPPGSLSLALPETGPAGNPRTGSNQLPRTQAVACAKRIAKRFENPHVPGA